MFSNFNHTTRRRFFTFLGGGAVLGIATQNLVSIAQTTAPTQSLDAIDILENDHRQIEALMSQIAQTPASNPAQRTKLLKQLTNLLTLHNFSEENFIYPAVRDIANLPSDATLLYNQQDTSKVLAFELDQTPKNDDPGWIDRFTTFQTALLAHVKQEEGTDFPQVRAALGPKIAKITAEMVELRSHWTS